MRGNQLMLHSSITTIRELIDGKALADPETVFLISPETRRERTIKPREPLIPCPLSPAQERVWFLEQLALSEPLYNEVEAVRIRGRLQLELLQQALNVIIDRHEVLRMTIEVVEGR